MRFSHISDHMIILRLGALLKHMLEHLILSLMLVKVCFFSYVCREQNNLWCLAGRPIDRQCLSYGLVSHKGPHAAGYWVSSIH